MCFRKFRKVIAGCTIGIGVGILLIIFLPVTAWFCIIAICLIASGIKKLFEK